MPATFDKQGRVLLIVGPVALAAGSVCLRFRRDFRAGPGDGAGVTAIAAAWLRR